jgi:hypothetical protein
LKGADGKWGVANPTEIVVFKQMARHFGEAKPVEKVSILKWGDFRNSLLRMVKVQPHS